MKTFLCILFFNISFSFHSQVKILFLGNVSNICFKKDSVEIIKANKLPDTLLSYNSIFIFSTAESNLSSNDINLLQKYLENGGGLYCGAENWPLQAESHQITMALYSKESWGNFEQVNGQIKSEKTKNELFTTTDTFPAGSTTVAFPMDYRLKVEVWVNDQPLIQSGNVGRGKIIIDGGYSRFYCGYANAEIDEIFLAILKYLNE